jgi:DNA-directed RNA polymerase subunit RPC12/RpoP
MTRKPPQKAPYLCLKCNEIMYFGEAGKKGEKKTLVKCRKCGKTVFMDKVLREQVLETIEELLEV